MKVFKCVLIDPFAKRVEELNVKDNLQDWYQLLDCDVVQILQVALDKGDAALICDEEGLLKADQKSFAFTKSFSPVLCMLDGNGYHWYYGRCLLCNVSMLSGSPQDIPYTSDQVEQEILWEV